MYDFGIVKSMKDFYWDVRPKPEFGTVEIRVCDTPLTVDRAAQIAAYAQALARRLWAERVDWVTPDLYLVHPYNRFQAARHGLAEMLVDPAMRAPVGIAEDIQLTLRELFPHAVDLASTNALEAVLAIARGEGNDAAWLRKTFAEKTTLPDVVREQAARLHTHLEVRPELSLRDVAHSLIATRSALKRSKPRSGTDWL